jgi:hypothetical protein
MNVKLSSSPETESAADQQLMPLAVFQASRVNEIAQFPQAALVFQQARLRVVLESILKEACSQAYPESAICVQRFDDSLNSAIRITYRILLRSSSIREPRYPLLRVVLYFIKIVTEQHVRDRSQQGQLLGYKVQFRIYMELINWLIQHL